MMRISLPGRTDELFGVKDENLRSLEEILKVRIKNDGSDLIIEGAEAGERQTVSVLNQLTTMMANGYALAGGDVRLAATLVSENENADLKDFLLKAVVRSGKKTIVPRSFNQRRYLTPKPGAKRSHRASKKLPTANLPHHLARRQDEHDQMAMPVPTKEVRAELQAHLDTLKEQAAPTTQSAASHLPHHTARSKAR